MGSRVERSVAVLGLALAVALTGIGCPRPVDNPGCGDAILGPGEECDDGNDEPGDGCTPDCLLESVCGNGIVDFGEQCEL